MNIHQELRAKYRDTWGRDWPHDNKFLQTLWAEAKVEVGIPPKSKQNCGPAKEFCLTVMRENHEFEPEPMTAN